MEYQPALSILRVVARLLRDQNLYDYSRAPCRKRPPGPGTSLQTTPLQDPASLAINKSRAAQSIKDSSGGLQDHLFLIQPIQLLTDLQL
jgi:hypothetical protein